jgi:hypothetical protein
LKAPGWLIKKLEKRALKGVVLKELSFPKDLVKFEKSVLLMPEFPDKTALKIADELGRLLGEKLKAVISFAGEPRIKGVEFIKLGKESLTLFDYPKKSACEKLRGYGAAIDLSPNFALPLSALPVWAGIEIRVGRDATCAGNAYNIIVEGISGAPLRALLATERKGVNEREG